MRVLLADDHSLLLEGLQNLLEAHGIEVVGTARDGGEAATQARSLKPDIILMDVRMPGCDGLAATRIIKAELPQIKIVMLTTSTEEQDLFEAVKSGATGYLLKSMDSDALVQALHDAQEDVPPFAPGLAAKLLAEFARTAGGPAQAAPTAPGEARASAPGETPGEASSPAAGQAQAPAALSSPAPAGAAGEEPLTTRQVEVLTLVAQGLSYKEVGTRVCLSARTVKYHMAEIMRKLHLQNRAQIIAYATGLRPEGNATDVG